MLHIISTSSEHEVLFARIAPGDALLFIGSAVLCLHKSSQAAKSISASSQQFQYYALQPDLLARGLAADDIISDISIVDYQGFVTLTLAHKVIKSWT
jgi:tRNA 2-thiouridine synthesizing protein B